MEYDTIISHSGDEKYIVVEITNSESKKSKLVIISHPVHYHSELVAKAERELQQNESIVCLGGGILKINRNKKTISTYGKSGGFGAPEADQVLQILQNSKVYGEFDLDVKVTNYIRD